MGKKLKLKRYLSGHLNSHCEYSDHSNEIEMSSSLLCVRQQQLGNFPVKFKLYLINPLRNPNLFQRRARLCEFNLSKIAVTLVSLWTFTQKTSTNWTIADFCMFFFLHFSPNHSIHIQHDDNTTRTGSVYTQMTQIWYSHVRYQPMWWSCSTTTAALSRSGEKSQRETIGLR